MTRAPRGRPAARLAAVVLAGGLAGFAALAFSLRGAAALYPQLVAGAAAALALAWAAAAWRDAAVDAELAALAVAPPRLALFAAIWLAYPLALAAIGFLAASWAALALTALALGTRRPFAVAVALAPTVLAVALLLRLVVYVPLPAAWPEMQLDRLLFLLRHG